MKDKEYAARYYYNESWYGIKIHAKNWSDAEDICKRHNLQLDGEIKFTLPWPLGWIASLFIGRDY